MKDGLVFRDLHTRKDPDLVMPDRLAGEWTYPAKGKIQWRKYKRN